MSALRLDYSRCSHKTLRPEPAWPVSLGHGQVCREDHRPRCTSGPADAQAGLSQG